MYIHAPVTVTLLGYGHEASILVTYKSNGYERAFVKIGKIHIIPANALAANAAIYQDV